MIQKSPSKSHSRKRARHLRGLQEKGTGVRARAGERARGVSLKLASRPLWAAWAELLGASQYWFVPQTTEHRYTAQTVRCRLSEMGQVWGLSPRRCADGPERGHSCPQQHSTTTMVWNSVNTCRHSRPSADRNVRAPARYFRSLKNCLELATGTVTICCPF